MRKVTTYYEVPSKGYRTGQVLTVENKATLDEVKGWIVDRNPLFENVVVVEGEQPVKWERMQTAKTYTQFYQYDMQRMNLLVHMGENDLGEQWLNEQIAELNAANPEHAAEFERRRQAQPVAQERKGITYLDPREGDDGAFPER